jgi:outer membrane protein
MHRQTPATRLRTASARRCRAASLLLACTLATLGSLAAPADPQSGRIGYVDMKRLLDNAPQVVAGRDALQREFAQRDTELKAQEQRLAELEDRQRREAALLPKADADARQAEINTLRRSIERLRTRLREELGTRADEETRQRWGEIQDVVVEFAREGGYDLVVQSPVIYASAAVDITDEVLERLRSKATAARAPQ